MGILRKTANWLRRKSRKSPFTLIEGPDGEKMLVDAPTLTYLKSVGPQPTQASLDSLMDRVEAVRVFGSGCDGDLVLGSDVILDVNEPTALSALRVALKIVDGPGGHCMCHGGPTLEMLSADGTRLALLGIHHGRAIRWNQWKDDAVLADGRSLLDWLAERGVVEPLRDFEAAEAQEHQRHRAWDRWVDARPEFLKALPEQMWEDVTRTGDLTAVLAAVAEMCPDVRDRISSLFDWYGNGLGRWTGYPDWEELAERMLLTFPQTDLIEAAASRSLTEAGLEGAARLLAGAAFQTHGQGPGVEGQLSIWYSEFDLFQPKRSGEPIELPEELRRRLWDHCQKSEDPDKRQRGESAFRARRRH